MWTPEGRAKSIHNREVSTVKKLTMCTGWGYDAPIYRISAEARISDIGYLLETTDMPSLEKSVRSAEVPT